MKFWFDKILVGSWLPEGQSGIWSVKKTVISGTRLEWLRLGGDEYGDLLAPGTYTGLFRKLADGSEQRVMFDEPREIKEALAFVEKAKGNVLVTGLGIGMVAMWLANKKEVTQVDVIENSQDVIDLVAPHLPSSKIRVIHADAFTFVPTEKYDSAWHDCFYEVPEREKELTRRLPIKTQEIWRPGVLTQPAIRRRSNIQRAVVFTAIMLAALKKFSYPEASAPSLVQQHAAGANVTNTLSSGTTSGNSLIALIAENTTTTGVSGGGTWVKDVAQLGVIGASTGEVSIWHVHNATAGTTVITITRSGRTTLNTCSNVSEWSGLNNATSEATNSNTDTVNATVTTNSVTPSSAASLVIAIGAWTANDYSSGPTNSFTQMTSVNGVTLFVEGAYQIETSAAAYSTGWTLTSGINWAAAIAVFGSTTAAAVVPQIMFQSRQTQN